MASDLIGKSCLKTVTKKFTLDSYGKNKTEAYAYVFQKLTKEEYAAVNGLVIQAEPLDVILEAEEELTTAKKVIGFFDAKSRRDYYVKLTIEVRIRYIEF